MGEPSLGSSTSIACAWACSIELAATGVGGVTCTFSGLSSFRCFSRDLSPPVGLSIKLRLERDDEASGREDDACESCLCNDASSPLCNDDTSLLPEKGLSSVLCPVLPESIRGAARVVSDGGNERGLSACLSRALHAMLLLPFLSALGEAR